MTRSAPEEKSHAAYEQIELVGGYFEPGNAFPGADPAWLARLQLRYRF